MTHPILEEVPPETILARLRIALEVADSMERQIKDGGEASSYERGWLLGVNLFRGLLKN